MDDWTFEPVYPEVYSERSPKVIIVGPEPNEGGARPSRKDMGYWFRTAPTNYYWGNQIFYDATLQQLHAVLAPGLSAETNDLVMTHMRYVDLKATGGGGSTSIAVVATWVHDHLDQVTKYWVEDRPDFTVIQGRIAQRVFEDILMPALIARNVEGVKIGLLHPSGQNRNRLNNPAYVEALGHMHEHLHRMAGPLIRWDPSNKKWLMDQRGKRE